MAGEKKLAIVTGASGGIGEQCAYTLAKNGYSILLVARREERLKHIADQIRQHNSVECFTLTVDVTKKESIDKIFDMLVKVNIPLHLLINNAGGSQKNALLENLELEDWYEVFALNLFSVVSLTCRLLPLINNEGKGRIVNISSINAKFPGFFNPHYSAAKAALNNFTKHLSRQVAANNITVNTVSPGIIETEGWHKHMENQVKEKNACIDEVVGEARLNAVKTIPLKRLGKAIDVAEMVGFLTSESAGYITGSDFTVDGGKRFEM